MFNLQYRKSEKKFFFWKGQFQEFKASKQYNVMSKCLCIWWATLKFLEQSFALWSLFRAVVLNPVNPILPFSEKYFIKPLYYPEIRFKDKTYLFPLKKLYPNYNL